MRPSDAAPRATILLYCLPALDHIIAHHSIPNHIIPYHTITGMVWYGMVWYGSNVTGPSSQPRPGDAMVPAWLVGQGLHPWSTLMQIPLISTVSKGQLRSFLLLPLLLQSKEWVPFPAEADLAEAASVIWLIARGDWVMKLKFSMDGWVQVTKKCCPVIQR